MLVTLSAGLTMELLSAGSLAGSERNQKTPLGCLGSSVSWTLPTGSSCSGLILLGTYFWPPGLPGPPMAPALALVWAASSSPAPQPWSHPYLPAPGLRASEVVALIPCPLPQAFAHPPQSQFLLGRWGAIRHRAIQLDGAWEAGRALSMGPHWGRGVELPCT